MLDESKLLIWVLNKSQHLRVLVDKPIHPPQRWTLLSSWLHHKIHRNILWLDILAFNYRNKILNPFQHWSKRCYILLQEWPQHNSYFLCNCFINFLRNPKPMERRGGTQISRHHPTKPTNGEEKPNHSLSILFPLSLTAVKRIMSKGRERSEMWSKRERRKGVRDFPLGG